MRFAAFAVLLYFNAAGTAQQPQQQPAQTPVPAPTIEEYEPRAVLVVPRHEVKRAKYPFIDIHTHQRNLSPASIDALLRDMDSINMRAMVTSPVSGSFGARTKALIDALKAHRASGRFLTMTNVNFKDLKGAAAQLEEDLKAGAAGVKVWKNFGLTEKDSDGKRLAVDDPRLNEVWAVAAKYRAPVLIHTADPKPLFEPMDKYNERWLELRQRPNRDHATGGPSWDQLIAEQHNLFARNPKTTFIMAHMGWLAHDLGALGGLLDKLPNVHVEFAAILGELGRQPRAVKRFFTRYQDRVLFGKDRYELSEYPFYFRLLETDDEWIPNIRKYHGLWQLYAFDLPDDVLKKIYYKNALRLFPALSKEGFPD
ncbi:MAG TPA: amidohydrolase family protein [Bryobacteraceae bacterium]|nr:amidohydrolase family protein [Bryobacteraceae bacterium]